MRNLISQAVKFVGLSGVGWILDFCTYTVLGILINTISSCVGLTFVFLFATKKIFRSNSRISLRWKYLIYILYQCVLIFFISKLLNSVNIFIVEHVTIGLFLEFAAIISKILVTPITMVLNFFVMKGVIEKL